MTSPCSDVRLKNTKALAADVATKCATIPRGISRNPADETMGKVSVGMPLSARENMPHSVSSPSSRPAICTRSGTGSGVSTKASRLAGNSVCQRTTQTTPMAPADMSRKRIRSPQNARSSISGWNFRIIGYLTRCCAGRNSAGPTRNAAAQISAGACMPCGMRSLCRNPSNVARAIVRA